MFDIKDFERNLTHGNLIRKCVEREFHVAVFRHGVKVGAGPRDLGTQTRDPPLSLKVGPQDPLQSLKVGPSY